VGWGSSLCGLILDCIHRSAATLGERVGEHKDSPAHAPGWESLLDFQDGRRRRWTVYGGRIGAKF